MANITSTMKTTYTEKELDALAAMMLGAAASSPFTLDGSAFNAEFDARLKASKVDTDRATRKS